MPSRAPFVVGINMPWGAFAGHDFGLRPHGWGDARQDWSAVEAELRALRALGVRVVRWFVLGAGVNYPCRSGPERAADARGMVPQAIDDFARRVARRARFSRGTVSLRARARGHASTAPADGFEFEWLAPPPPLSEDFLADFVALCRACQRAELQLLPSLLSFEWFQPARHKGKGVFAGGRAGLLFGSAAQRNVQAPVAAFLDATLAPLLARSQAAFGAPVPGREHEQPIFAWESVNEPDWVTQGGPRLLRAPAHPVGASAMNALLAAFRARVLAAGYDHSIGFKQLSPRWLDPALRAQLCADGPRYWHQGHHYPTAGAGRWLEASLATNRTLPARPPEFCRCLIGEFPSGQGARRTPSNARWGDAELAHSERDGERYLEARLSLMQQRGYHGALLWNAKRDDPDPRCAWSATTQRQLAAFAASQAQPARARFGG